MRLVPLPPAKTKHETKYLPLAELLRQRILDGTYVGRLPTYHQLIQELGGISSVTLQKAINCLAEAGLVTGQGNRGVLITRLRRARTNRIGIIVPGLRGPLTSQVVHSVIAAAHQQDQGVIVKSHHADVDVMTRSAQRLFCEEQVDGLIILWASRFGSTDKLGHFLAEHHPPCALIGEPDPARFPTCHHVGGEEQGRAVIGMLLERGLRRIAFADTVTDFPSATSSLRWQAFQDGLNSVGLTSPPPLILPGDGTEPADLVQRLRSLEAVMCATDTAALRLLSHALHYGLRVPQDLSITGYDATLPAELLGLASVDAHYERQGAEAFAAVFAEIEGRSTGLRQIQIPSELKPGTSVRGQLSKSKV